MATPEEVYNNWRTSLKEPDDSLFYYHSNLERLLLGLTMFVLSSRPLLSRISKAESLGILHYQVPDLITAWIDGDDKAFEEMFNMVMTVSEAYMSAGKAMIDRYPEKEKSIKRLCAFFGGDVAITCDMLPEKAEALLDNLSTDGEQIYSDKIRAFGDNLFRLTSQYGMDIPLPLLQLLMADKQVYH